MMIPPHSSTTLGVRQFPDFNEFSAF